MQRPVTFGLLPLYLKLYREVCPAVEAEFQPFMDGICAGLKQRGIEAVKAPVCAVASEFGSAVSALEKAGVDCIVTVHLAYSPSLESIEALAGTSLPVLILDTTMDAAFGQSVDPSRIMYNHGIHGVQDMANLLRRRKKTFHIVAGHTGDRTVLDRAAGIIRAAHAARELRSTKALRIGSSFHGMGDFAVSEDVLRRTLGITVDTVDTGAIATAVRALDPKAIAAEMALDKKGFAVTASDVALERSCRVGLGVRAILERGGYSAFSMNFLAFDSKEAPVDTTPFLEAAKAMARGIGYGGEGDVLTASVTGAILRAFGDTTFTEIFCPDWTGNSLFLSHMGEVNPRVLQKGTATIREQARTFSPTNPGAYITGALREGEAVFVNCAPGPDDTFALIIAPVTVLPDTTVEAMKASVRGWIRPACPVATFLEEYSKAGGTHHSTLVMGNHTEALAAFARYAGMEPVVIK